MSELSLNSLLAVPLAPLVGSIAAGLFGKTIGRRGAHLLTILGVLISFIISAMTLKAVAVDGASFNGTVYEWMTLGTLKMEVGFLVDGLTAMMMCVVTFVSLMVHIYSFGYMKGETGFQRYYAFLSLFTMSMLGLVVATNIFQMYIFWELVGVSSYLLIGFYYTKPTAVAASKKAFIVTRFADLGFLLGILILSFFGNTFSFTELIAGTIQSFCISIPKNQSILNSKNSHKTPTVIEKQNAKNATKYGDILIENRSLLLNKSISANPIAAIRNPFVVCKMVSHTGIFT